MADHILLGLWEESPLLPILCSFQKDHVSHTGPVEDISVQRSIIFKSHKNVALKCKQQCTHITLYTSNITFLIIRKIVFCSAFQMQEKEIACMPCRSLPHTGSLLKTLFPWEVHFVQPTGISLNAEAIEQRTGSWHFPLLIRLFFFSRQEVNYFGKFDITFVNVCVLTVLGQI